ncbi:MAG: PucR family transcriptional regulator [Erysipelotrichaceae bacterium]|nr:PucR family transcriptional regulator [Erysipelotrichaceae bacterium]
MYEKIILISRQGTNNMANLKEILGRLRLKVLAVKEQGRPLEYTGAAIFEPGECVQPDTLYIIADVACIQEIPDVPGGCLILSKEDIHMPFEEYAVLSAALTADELCAKTEEAIRDYFRLALKKSRIYACIGHTNAVREITRTVADILGNPTGIGNAETRMIALEGPESNDATFREFSDFGYSSQTTIMHSRRMGVFNRIMKEEKPVLFNKSDRFKCRRILGKVMIGGRLAAICGVSEEYRKFEWDTVAVIETMIQVLETAIQNEFPLLMPQTREMILTRLFNREITDESALSAMMQSIHWEPKKTFCLCVIGELDPYMLTDAFPGIHAMAREICSSACICLYRSYLAVLVNEEDEKTCLQQLSLFRKLADDMNLSGAISGYYTDLMKTESYLQQAVQILVSSKMTASGENWFDFDHYGFNAALSVLPGRMQYVHPGIQRLSDQDREKSTEYMKTLKMYLECGINASKTAAGLFIHRNTLYSRLEQIEAISGLDLSNGQDLFNASLSLRILAYEKGVSS